MRLRIVVAALAAALVLAGCGESDQEKAQSKVCDARAEISKQVDALKALTPSTVTIDQVKQSVDAIGSSLKDIADAQGDLSDERRSQVQEANQAFSEQIKGIGSSLLQSTSVADARTQLQQAVTQLGESYNSSLARVDCG
ncbi:MAG: hypothetical protein HZB46_00430 [Solirubrobacterales bacterium]|nr:hypothetical protein [Solirubrobacterales bacterium]